MHTRRGIPPVYWTFTTLILSLTNRDSRIYSLPCIWMWYIWKHLLFFKDVLHILHIYLIFNEIFIDFHFIIFIYRFSLWKFFNLSSKSIISDDEVGKSLKSSPIGELINWSKAFSQIRPPLLFTNQIYQDFLPFLTLWWKCSQKGWTLCYNKKRKKNKL